ncbi:UNVERIFIED_CONTAM: hypothetical protein FKN15_029151, partial [Acipenser sinensis]
QAIRRWLGSMVDALAYLHKQNFIHRNLKPSNILLKQDLSFQVSDFQVHSMADDELKLKIRIKEKFMKKYNDIEEAQISAMNYLLKADQDKVSAGKIGKAGGIPELLKAMRTFIHNRDICMSCCGALWSLVLNGRNARIASAEGALLTVCSAGEVYLQDEVLMESVCSALWSLILQGSAHRYHHYADDEHTLYSEACAVSLPLVFNSARPPCSQPRATASEDNAALGSLQASPQVPDQSTGVAELAAFRVLLPPAGTNGFQVVAEVYRYHTDDTEVVENICSLFYEIAQYGRLIFPVY